MNLPIRPSGLFAGLCALVLLATTACRGGEPVNVGGAKSSGGAGGTLAAAVNGEPDSLDPHKAVAYVNFEVLENIFDTLVQPDANMNMAPALATSWTTSTDQLSWTFNLRTTNWQDGTAFTSDDVVYSYRRLMDGKLPWSTRLATVKTVTAAGPRQVVIKLKKPTPNLLVQLGGFKAVAIVQKKNVESGAIKQNPVGTGPFKLASWAHGSALNLVANPGYWGGKPKLAGVKFTFVGDPTVALQNLRGGEVQWTDNLPPQQVESLEKSTGADFTVKAPLGYGDFWFVALNEAHKPYGDKKVRQAIAYAMNRAAVVRAAKFGTCVVTQTAIPVGNTWHYDYAPYVQDTAKAKSLLAAAGVQRLKLSFIATKDYPETVTAGQVLASELAPLGIEVKIRTLDLNTFLAELTGGHWDGVFSGVAGAIDPSDFYYLQHHTGGAFNVQKYSNPDVDKLMDKANVTVDQAQRKALYDQAAKHIVDDASYIFMCNTKVVQGFSRKLHGYAVRPDRAIRFANAWLG